MDLSSLKTTLQVLIVYWTTMLTSPSNAVTLCSCYTFQNQTKSWEESEIYCKTKGGHLVSIETEKEWELINSKIQSINLTNSEWYIGLFKCNDTRDLHWKWISNQNLTYADKWCGYALNNTDKNCVVMATELYSKKEKGFFKNVNCSHPKASICEYDQGKDISDCDLKSKPCWNSTKRSKNARRTPTEITNIPNPNPNPNPNPDFVYVVIALGILLAAGICFYIFVFYCKKGKSEYRQGRSENKSIGLRTRTSRQVEESTATLLQAESVAETSVKDDDTQIDMECPTEEIQVDEHDKESHAEVHVLLPDPSSASTQAGLFSVAYVKQQKPQENKDDITPEMPKPYKDNITPEMPKPYKDNITPEMPKPYEDDITQEMPYEDDITPEMPYKDGITPEMPKPYKDDINPDIPKLYEITTSAESPVYSKVDKSKKTKKANKQEVVYAKPDKSRKNDKNTSYSSK